MAFRIIGKSGVNSFICGIIILLLALPTGSCLQGQNLVPNPGFELNNALPDDNTQWHFCEQWSNVNDTIPSQAPYASPDYFHEDGSGIVKLPNSFFATVNPNSGKAIMGLVTWLQFTPDYREYISAQLIQPLQPGLIYEVSFFASRGRDPYNPYATDHLGIHFSYGKPTQADHEPIAVVPDYDIGVVFEDTNWVKITFQYSPASPVDHITIGNFFADNQTNSELTNGGNGNGAYVFIDDVSVTELQNTVVYGDTAVCAGDSVTLTAEGEAPIYWETVSMPGDTIGTGLLLKVAVSDPTGFIAMGKWGRDTAYVQILDPPVVQLGNDTLLCDQDTLRLRALAVNVGEYNWSTGEATKAITVKTSGPFRVTVTNTCGADSDTVEVTFSKVYLNTPGKVFACKPDSAIIQAQSDTGVSISWSNGGTGPVTATNQQGPIYALAENQHGCTAQDTTLVVVGDAITPDLPPDTQICLNTTLALSIDTTKYSSWQWSTGSVAPMIEVSGNIAISIQTTDTNGCRNSNTIMVKTRDCSRFLKVPNAFTPNNDGLNEVFRPLAREVELMEFRIYNRWGELIFHGDPEEGWDGNHRGVPAPVGVYAYVIRYRMNSEMRVKTGNVTLLR